MKEYRIEQEKVKEFFDKVEDIERVLTERISELHEVKGAMQTRHAFVYYRSLVWESKRLIKNNIKELKTLD